MKDTSDEFKHLDLSNTDIFDPIDLREFDFDPEELEKRIAELEKALKGTEKS